MATLGGTCVCVCVCVSFSDMSDSEILWTIANQTPLFMEFSRKEYWSGEPVPSPGDFSDSWVEPMSHALQADSLPFEPPGKPPVEGAGVGNYLPQTWIPHSVTDTDFLYPS